MIDFYPLKKHVLVLLLFPMIFSCNSQEKRAQKLIKEEMRLTLNDFKSYEPVQYGTLDSAFLSYEDSPQVKLYQEKLEEFQQEAELLNNLANILKGSDKDRNKSEGI